MIEVEVKALIGDDDRKAMILSRELDVWFTGSEKQLNHYFKASENSMSLGRSRFPDFFRGYVEKAGDGIPSVRTREVNGSEVYLIFKATIGDDSSENGTARIEHEELIDWSIDRLDSILEECGMTVRSKWSRDRWNYSKEGTTICLDKNAGYGWILEVENITSAQEHVERSRNSALKLLKEFGLEELDPVRLERMFAYYEANWRNYYGTDKRFTLE